MESNGAIAVPMDVIAIRPTLGKGRGYRRGPAAVAGDVQGRAAGGRKPDGECRRVHAAPTCTGARIRSVHIRIRGTGADIRGTDTAPKSIGPGRPDIREGIRNIGAGEKNSDGDAGKCFANA